MTIENLTPEAGTLTQPDGTWLFNFGQIKKNIPKSFTVLIKDASHFSSQKGCGSCTTVNAEDVGEDIKLTVTFNAVGSGMFTKSVTETTKTNGIITIKFTGTLV